MATAMEYENESSRPYEDEPRGYDRDRSRSPRIDRRDDDSRARSASPNGRGRLDDHGPPPPPRPNDDDDDDPGAVNTGSNLFVTGIHPRLAEDDVRRLFEKYGTVENCNVMRDPHTRDSRGFGFVKMATSDEADAAKEGLQGEVYEGRTLSIEKARRARPRTPTPGKYFGPPKRDDFRRRRGGYGDRYDDRRGGYGRRDDYGPPRPRYDDRYDDRYGGRRRDDRRYPEVDRYATRDDGYDRRGGGYGSSGGREAGYGREPYGRDDGGRGGAYETSSKA